MLYNTYIYDIRQSKRNREAMLNWILVVLVALSGCSFCVGADIPGYMDDYDFYTVKDIIDFENGNPIGWKAFNVFCKSISEDFAFLKITNAILVNYTVVRFVKKNSSSPFGTILLYFIIIFPLLSFNILKQSMAFVILLIAFEYIKSNLKVYYVLILLAISFHQSAVVLLLIPLFGYIRFSKRILYVGLIVGFVLLVVSNYHVDTLLNIFYLFSDENDMITGGAKMSKYLNYTKFEVTSMNILGIIESMLFFSLTIWVSKIYYIQAPNKSSLICMLSVLCGTLVLLNNSIPVVFYRLMQYFYIFQIIVYSDVLFGMFRRKKSSPILAIVIMIAYCYIPIKTYFSINPTTGIPLYYQYTPYYSVFDKQYSPVRVSYFGKHE